MRVLKLASWPVKAVLILVIRFYQRAVSPFLPATCRFTPSCSQYMLEAVQKKGVLRGLVMGAWRLLRCNPLFHGGHDPVR